MSLAKVIHINRAINASDDGPKKHGREKLDAEDIPIIRELIADGMIIKEIAQKFEVSISTIWKIGAGQSWRHIK